MEKVNILKYTAIFEPEKDGGYSVSVPALPGCFSEGATFEEAKRNIKEAIQCHLESLLLDNEEIPIEGEEVITSTVVLTEIKPKEKVKV